MEMDQGVRMGSYEEMAQRFNMSKYEIVKRLKGLEQMGFVTIKRQRGRQNVYYVHFKPRTLAS